MTTENDPIDRALIRAHGIAGSPLEKTLRLHAYKLIDTGDGTKTDANLDEFVREQRADPFYASSFTAPPGPAKAAGIDTLALSEEQRSDIDAGKLVIEAETKQETATIGTATVQPSEEELDEIIASGKVRVG
jgi:hypothetical protein